MLPKLDTAQAPLQRVQQCRFVSIGAAAIAQLMLHAHTGTHPRHWTKISSRPISSVALWPSVLLIDEWNGGGQGFLITV